MNANPITVAIFGVGPGLGLSAARHFGAQGHHVALVARNRGPIPMMSQLGILLSALRHHLLGLAEAARAQGVRVGLLIIGGLILGSDIQRVWVPDAGPDFPGALDPDELAAEFSALLADDSGPERIVGPPQPDASSP